MKDIQIWVTYHDDKLLETYKLHDTEMIKLFKGNEKLACDNINFLNKFYSELTTLYYVWKNKQYSEVVGFCHYRRMFRDYINIEEGTCQVFAIHNVGNIFQNYKSAHNYQDMYDAIDVINDLYGHGNKYSEYILKSGVFIPCCCFIMRYTDFDKLCDWLFPILFAWDKKNGLNMDPEIYMVKAKADFRYDDVNYQCRAVAFLAERLISCYIVTEMRPFCINTIH